MQYAVPLVSLEQVTASPLKLISMLIMFFVGSNCTVALDNLQPRCADPRWSLCDNDGYFCCEAGTTCFAKGIRDGCAPPDYKLADDETVLDPIEQGPWPTPTTSNLPTTTLVPSTSSSSLPSLSSPPSSFVPPPSSSQPFSIIVSVAPNSPSSNPQPTSSTYRHHDGLAKSDFIAIAMGLFAGFVAVVSAYYARRTYKLRRKSRKMTSGRTSSFRRNSLGLERANGERAGN